MNKSFVVLLTLLIFFNVQAKPRVAPSLSIWGVLLEHRIENEKSFFKIQTEFINGKKNEGIIEIQSKAISDELATNENYHFYFFYPKFDKNYWDVKIISGGLGKYRISKKSWHSNDISFDSSINRRLKIGWNKLFVLIRNKGNYFMEVKVNDLKLLNSQAFGARAGIFDMKYDVKLGNAEIENYEIKSNKDEFTIPPHFIHICELNIFIDEQYKIEREYYLYKDRSKTEIDTLKTIGESLAIWGDIEYKDELGNLHQLKNSYSSSGLILHQIIICSDKNDNCKHSIYVL